jgi:hypothetical protein
MVRKNTTGKITLVIATAAFSAVTGFQRFFLPDQQRGARSDLRDAN